MDVEFIDHSAEAKDAKNGAVEKFLTEAGLHLEGQAKKELANSPKRIDTGLLRNSITHALDGEPAAIGSYSASNPSKYGGKDKMHGEYGGQAPEEGGSSRAVYVGTNVEYAPYVHAGTRRMAANPFIAKAFSKNANQLKNKLKQALMGG